MGFWANFLTPKKKRAEQFSDASTGIREGVQRRLLDRFTREHGPEEGRLLAEAVAAELFSKKQIEDDVRAYMKSNKKILKESLDSLKNDPEITKAVSWLLLVVDGIMRKNPKAFPDEFEGNPVDNLKENGLLPEGAREPLVEDFLAFAGEFSASGPQRPT